MSQQWKIFQNLAQKANVKIKYRNLTDGPKDHKNYNSHFGAKQFSISDENFSFFAALSLVFIFLSRISFCIFS